MAARAAESGRYGAALGGCRRRAVRCRCRRRGSDPRLGVVLAGLGAGGCSWLGAGRASACAGGTGTGADRPGSPDSPRGWGLWPAASWPASAWPSAERATACPVAGPAFAAAVTAWAPATTAIPSGPAAAPSAPPPSSATAPVPPPPAGLPAPPPPGGGDPPSPPPLPLPPPPPSPPESAAENLAGVGQARHGRDGDRPVHRPLGLGLSALMAW